MYVFKMKQVQIGRLIIDHSGLVVRAVTKPAGEEFSTKVEISALLVGLVHARALCLVFQTYRWKGIILI